LIDRVIFFESVKSFFIPLKIRYTYIRSLCVRDTHAASIR